MGTYPSINGIDIDRADYQIIITVGGACLVAALQTRHALPGVEFHTKRGGAGSKCLGDTCKQKEDLPTATRIHTIRGKQVFLPKSASAGSAGSARVGAPHTLSASSSTHSIHPDQEAQHMTRLRHEVGAAMRVSAERKAKAQADAKTRYELKGKAVAVDRGKRKDQAALRQSAIEAHRPKGKYEPESSHRGKGKEKISG